MEPPTQTRNPLWRVSKYLLRYRGLFILTLVLAVASTAFLLTIPSVVRWVFDSLVAANDVGKLALGVGLIGFLYLGREIFNSLRIRVNNVVEQKVLVDLRCELHRKLLDLPVAFYDRRKSGEVASRVIEDVQDVERALLDGTEQGLVALLMLLGSAGLLIWLEPLLALFVLLPIPVVLGLGIYYAKMTRKNWRRVRDAQGQLNSLTVEDIQGNRLIHSFALKDRERRRFHDQCGVLKDRVLYAMFRWSLYSPTANYISSLGTLAVIGAGGYQIMTDPEFTIGQLLAAFFYANMLYEPISRLHGLNHLFATAKASGDRVFEVLDHDVDILDPEDPKPFPTGLLEVTYEGVAFAYADRPEVISGLELTLPAGKTTALVGHTGAGKSTLANLLLRYYDTTGGRVAINGIDVRDFRLEELRGNIGYVAQDPFLFDGTVDDNLRLARPSARDDELRAALEGARAWDFVDKLPQKMDTLIGERGIRLSMGEKQRLTIARVLLKNPPLVVLDEATASVDTVTERYIQEALETLMTDRTVLVIAHRLSTVRKAHQIVVLDHGAIVEKGTHDALIAQEGHYAALHRYQHDFIPETVGG